MLGLEAGGEDVDRHAADRIDRGRLRDTWCCSRAKLPARPAGDEVGEDRDCDLGVLDRAEKPKRDGYMLALPRSWNRTDRTPGQVRPPRAASAYAAAAASSAAARWASSK